MIGHSDLTEIKHSCGASMWGKKPKPMVTCPKCGGLQHGGTEAQQIGRFVPDPKHRADYPGAPLRETREEALNDYCQRQLGRNW